MRFFKKKTRIVAALIGVNMLFSLSGCAEIQESVNESVAESNVETVDEATAEYIDEILANMTLEEKIDQMYFVSFRTWKEVSETEKTSDDEIQAVNITELNDEIRAELKEHHYGGIVLFGENIKDAKQTAELVSDIQQTSLQGGGIPLLVAADQEGGNVARISFGTTGVGNMALAASGDSDNAKSMASIYGEELSLLGINTDLAPVMDVNNNPSNPIIGVRSFSDSPEMVSEYGIKYMEGLHDTGTIATIKHFPGHGNTDTDSHTGFPCILSSYEELKQCELIPFQEAIDAGADIVMTAHIQYPKIETEVYTSVSTGEQVYLPATMSSRILTDILRGDMGFEGVIVTDALEMAAIQDNFDTEEVLIRTINAGVNLLMVRTVYDSSDLKQLNDLTGMAVKLVNEGKIDEEKINDSVKRILTLKEKYGLLSFKDYSVTDEDKALSGVGSTENKERAFKIAKEALTLVKDDEALPIRVDDGQSVLILFADSCASRVATGALVRQELIDKGIVKEESQITVLVNDKENGEECMEEALNADHCILVYRTYSTDCLNPETDDGSSSSVFDGIIARRHEVSKKSVFVSCQLPYDAARFTDADAILIAYNSAVMREILPVSGEGSAYAPNLEAALMACFGDVSIDGQLPVNIPVLGENYQMTDQILFERGSGIRK